MPFLTESIKYKASLQDFSVERVEIKNLKQDSSCNLKTSIDGGLLGLDIKSEFLRISLFLLIHQILKHPTVTLN